MARTRTLAAPIPSRILRPLRLLALVLIAGQHPLDDNALKLHPGKISLDLANSRLAEGSPRTLRKHLGAPGAAASGFERHGMNTN